MEYLHALTPDITRTNKYRLRATLWHYVKVPIIFYSDDYTVLPYGMPNMRIDYLYKLYREDTWPNMIYWDRKQISFQLSTGYHQHYYLSELRTEYPFKLLKELEQIWPVQPHTKQWLRREQQRIDRNVAIHIRVIREQEKHLQESLEEIRLARLKIQQFESYKETLT